MTDKEKIRSEIERRIKEYDAIIESQPDSNRSERDAWKWAEDKSLLSFIDSLRQEQPEVDLEKGLADYCRRYYNYDYPKQAEEGTGTSVMPHIIEAARYFFELGQRKAKEESK